MSNGRPWSNHEIDLIRELLGAQNKPYKELSRLLNRSVGSIAAKARDINLPRRYRMKSTPADVERPVVIVPLGDGYFDEVKRLESVERAKEDCRGYLADLIRHHGYGPAIASATKRCTNSSDDEIARGVMNAQRLVRAASQVGGASALTLATW